MCGHAGPAWTQACISNPASGVRASGTGRCLHGGRVLPWVQYNVPRFFLLLMTSGCQLRKAFPGASLICVRSDGGLKNKARQGRWRATFRYCQQQSDATALGRTTAVMRHRRHILNLGNLDAENVQSAHSRFTTGAWALDTHFEVFYTIFDRNLAGGFCGNLRCKRRGFTRALEACATRSRPCQGIALTVGDRDDGVI